MRDLLHEEKGENLSAFVTPENIHRIVKNKVEAGDEPLARRDEISEKRVWLQLCMLHCSLGSEH